MIFGCACAHAHLDRMSSSPEEAHVRTLQDKLMRVHRTDKIYLRFRASGKLLNSVEILVNHEFYGGISGIPINAEDFSSKKLIHLQKVDTFLSPFCQYNCFDSKKHC